MQWKNEKGVALLMVISAITILSFTVTDFIAQTLMQHEVAINAKKRLQAYYLAKSGVQFSKLILGYSKKLEAQAKASKVGQQMMQSGAMMPLYQMIPLSTEQLRAFLDGGALPSNPETEAAEEDSGSLLDQQESLLKPSGSLMKQGKGKEFFEFEGDFESEISEEGAKFSVNTFSKMSAQSPQYDLYKKILLGVLQSPSFRHFFDNPEKDSVTLTHALADWVDTNQQINEFDQVERGSEDSIYEDRNFPIKNAKFLNLSEMRLVAGMNDDLFYNLEPLVTVFHTQDKVNICQADSQIVDALLVHFTTRSECTTPLDPKDAKTLQDIKDAILPLCPTPSAIASALNMKLGLQSSEDVSFAGASQTAEQQQTNSRVPGCKIQFEDLIAMDNSLYKIKATGRVGEITRVITSVWDMNGNNPQAWKMIYYNVQ